MLRGRLTGLPSGRGCSLGWGGYVEATVCGGLEACPEPSGLERSQLCGWGAEAAAGARGGAGRGRGVPGRGEGWGANIRARSVSRRESHFAPARALVEPRHPRVRQLRRRLLRCCLRRRLMRCCLRRGCRVGCHAAGCLAGRHAGEEGAVRVVAIQAHLRYREIWADCNPRSPVRTGLPGRCRSACGLGLGLGLGIGIG